MTDARLNDILNSWRLSADETGAAAYVTPAAHVAREQVLELVAYVQDLRRRLNAAVDIAIAKRSDDV